MNPATAIAQPAAAGAAPHQAGSSIRVVSEVTGLALHTLRAWERRYGIPSPERKRDSNRRLYSPADVERLTWVARALESGFRPADVIEKSPRQIRELLGAKELPAPSAASNAGGLDAGRAGVDVSELLKLVASNEVGRLERELRRAAVLLGAREFVTAVAAPLSVAVGESWARGTLAIRQEHLLTECLTTQLRLLFAARQDVAGGPVAVLATLPSEPHTLGVQMAAVYLSIGGATPCILGASSPALEIAATVREFRATIVGISVTQSADVRVTRRELRALIRALPSHVRVWVGGAGAANVARGIDRAVVVQSWSTLDERLGDLLHARGVRRSIDATLAPVR